MEKREIATFGAGCFWCVEAIFKQLKGVEKVVSGYSEGAEVIQVTFNPQIISYKNLLEVFWKVHDPTTLNRQGPDVGTQYRSVIFYHSDEQKNQAEESKKTLEKQKFYKDPIVTKIVPFENFYLADEYHQEYYLRNSDQPYCRIVIDPKIQKFKKDFSHLLA